MGNMTTPKVEWQEMEDCTHVVIGDFAGILAKGCRGGTDGSGGKEQNRWHSRVSAAAVVYSSELLDEYAIMYSRVPGRQTVPRAELWAIICTLKTVAIITLQIHIFYIDAQYILNGIASDTNLYRDGLNGDLWTMLYTVLLPIKNWCRFVKVKSHVTTESDWIKYGMTKEAFRCNYIADLVADEAAESFRLDRNVGQRTEDSNEWNETHNIALRIATIESHCWRNFV